MARDGVGRLVHRLADTTGYDQATDPELLSWFAEGRDERAFEALVRRHGRLVWSAASRVLADPNDVDDAVQATFLVLVRRARRSDWRADVGPWLYGVAHRVAVRLRARTQRGPGPLGGHAPAAPTSLPNLPLREACDLLHAELDRLPERYRLPLLLCYLEGQTRDQAATALGVSVGTVKGRVRQGCELLSRRLARRGVSLSIGLLGGMAPSTAGASDPATVVTALSGPPSPRVAELVREVTRAMSTAKFTLIPIGLVALTGLAYALLPTPAVAPATAVRATQVPEQRPAPMFLVLEKSGLAFLDASGAGKERVRTEKGAAFSPDGRWVAVAEGAGDPPKPELVIRPRNHKADPVTIPLLVDRKASYWDCRPVWAPDGKRLLIGENWIMQDGAGFHRYRVFDPESKELSELKLGSVEAITDWSRDGKRLLATMGGEWTRLAWLNADGTGEPEFITPKGEWGHVARLSPDGKRILYRGHPQPSLAPPIRPRLYVEDLATGKRTVLDETGVIFGYCWSPDGTRVAYDWQKSSLDRKAEDMECETFLFTCDPDGLNRKTVTSRKIQVPKGDQGSSRLILLDWR